MDDDDPVPPVSAAWDGRVLVELPADGRVVADRLGDGREMGGRGRVGVDAVRGEACEGEVVCDAVVFGKRE